MKNRDTPSRPRGVFRFSNSAGPQPRRRRSDHDSVLQASVVNESIRRSRCWFVPCSVRPKGAEPIINVRRQDGNGSVSSRTPSACRCDCDVVRSKRWASPTFVLLGRLGSAASIWPDPTDWASAPSSVPPIRSPPSGAKRLRMDAARDMLPFSAGSGFLRAQTRLHRFDGDLVNRPVFGLLFAARRQGQPGCPEALMWY